MVLLSCTPQPFGSCVLKASAEVSINTLDWCPQLTLTNIPWTPTSRSTIGRLIHIWVGRHSLQLTVDRLLIRQAECELSIGWDVDDDVPGGYLTKFNTGRLRPKVQPLTLLYTILAEKVPLSYTFYWKRYPFHISIRSSRLMNISLKRDIMLLFSFKAGFHKRWSRSRSRNRKRRAMRSSENQTEGVRSRTLHPLMTPLLTI